MWAYVIAGALLIGNVLALKYLYDKNLTLRGENAQVTMERDLSKQGAERLDLLLAEKIANDAKVAQEVARLRRGFTQEKKDDPELASWADTPLPAGAVRFLHEAGQIGREPDGADGADPDSTVADE